MTLTFLAGVLVILAGIHLTVNFFEILKLVFLGSLGPLLILSGLIIVAVAKE